MSATKQLAIYEMMGNQANRQTWRENTKTARSTHKVPFKVIEVMDGWNARKSFDSLAELADDIEANGLHEPLEGILSKNGKKFYIVEGERRFRAIKLIRERNPKLFTEVEVIPTPANLSPVDMLVRMLSSGVQKSMFKDVEVAEGLLRLKNDFNLSNEEIGKRMGRSRQWVDNMIKLAKQPEEIKKEVAEGKIKKTDVIVPMKDKVTDVTSGMVKPIPQAGLPASLKTDNAKAEKQEQTSPGAASQAAPTEVSGKDALQGVNFDKEANEQEGQINTVAKEVNKIEGLGKGLNDQAQKDLEKYLFVIRENITLLKEHYSKQKNKGVKTDDASLTILSTTTQWQEWTKQNFPKATSVGTLRHLEKEIRETLAEIDGDDPSIKQDEGVPLMEYADCFICLFTSAGKKGFTPEMLFKAITNKININYKREWVEQEDGTYAHKK